MSKILFIDVDGTLVDYENHWTNRETYGILIYKRARILAGCRKPETGFFRAPGLCAGGGRCKKEIVWH